MGACGGMHEIGIGVTIWVVIVTSVSVTSMALATLGSIAIKAAAPPARPTCPPGEKGFAVFLCLFITHEGLRGFVALVAFVRKLYRAGGSLQPNSNSDACGGSDLLQTV